jgi:hypothetical protein
MSETIPRFITEQQKELTIFHALHLVNRVRRRLGQRKLSAFPTGDHTPRGNPVARALPGRPRVTPCTITWRLWQRRIARTASEAWWWWIWWRPPYTEVTTPDDIREFLALFYAGEFPELQRKSPTIGLATRLATLLRRLLRRTR